MAGRYMTGREEEDIKIRNKIKNLCEWFEDEGNVKGFGHSEEPTSNYLKARLLDCSVRTVWEYGCVLKAFKMWDGMKDKTVPLRKRYKSEIVDYLEEKQCEGKSVAYRRGIFTKLKQYYDWIYEEGWWKENPMKGLKPPKKEINTCERTDYLTQEEVKILMGNIRYSNEKLKVRDNAIIRLLLATGIRVSALTGLNINDFDTENNRVRVYTKGNKIQEFALSIAGKDNATTKAIKDYLAIRDRYDTHNSNALFLSFHGKRLTEYTVKDLIRKYVSGINKHITPHKLRATFATTCLDRGLSLIDVQNLLGHSSLDMTRIYIRGRENKSQQASELMTSLFDDDDEVLNDDKVEISHKENQSDTYNDYDDYGEYDEDYDPDF